MAVSLMSEGRPSGSPAAPPSDPPKFRPFLDAFSSPAEEDRFRRATLGENRKQINGFLLIVAGGILVFGGIRSFAPEANEFSFGAWVNDIVILGAVATVHILISRTESVSRVDLMVSGIMAALIILEVTGIFRRPLDYFGHYVLDVFMIMFFYLAVPIPLLYRLSAAMAFTACLLWTFYFHKVLTYHLYASVVPLTFLLANITGAWLACRHGRLLRANFALLVQETEARNRLQDALDDVKTLSGLLPICAHCKKVRDDDGYWGLIETYLGEHSDLDFTHGICPDCFDREMRDFGAQRPPGKDLSPQ